MKAMQWLLVGILLVSHAPPVSAATFTDWSAYTKTVSHRQNPVFVSRCSLGKGYLAVVTFPVGSAEGSFFEVRFNAGGRSETLNFSDIEFKSGELISPDIAFGGIATLNYLDRTIRALLKAQFSMVAPSELSSMHETADTPPCPEPEK